VPDRPLRKRNVTAKPFLPRVTTGRPRLASPATAAGDENEASTVAGSLRATVHVVVVPLHEPAQPRNVAPAPGSAVSSTLSPAS